MRYIVTNAYFVTNKSYIVLIFITFNCGYIYVCCMFFSNYDEVCHDYADVK